MYKKIIFNVFIFISGLNICFADTESSGPEAWTKTERAAIERLGLHNLSESPEIKINKVANNSKAADLGHDLFFDPRLSSNGKVSCASCHQPGKYFTDGLKTAKGITTAKRNTPTIVGINQSNWLFLDGRADSLWSQAMMPLEDSHEHGSSRTDIAKIVYSDKKLRKRYEDIFGVIPDITDKQRFPSHAAPVKDKAAKHAWRSMSKKDKKTITTIFVNLAKAIAAYELKLNPAPSRFDEYALALSNNKASDVLTNNELSGLKLFLNKGSCIVCHHGPMFSDFGFHNIATPQVDVKKYDRGRYKGVSKLLRSKFNCYSAYNDAAEKNCDELKYIIRKKEHTIATFRTPSLRNVTKTSPYMHSGQYETLKDVIDHYESPPKTQVGSSDLIPFSMSLEDEEKLQLEAFLHALDSGVNADEKYIKAPE